MKTFLKKLNIRLTGTRNIRVLRAPVGSTITLPKYFSLDDEGDYEVLYLREDQRITVNGEVRIFMRVYRKEVKNDD